MATTIRLPNPSTIFIIIFIIKVWTAGRWMDESKILVKTNQSASEHWVGKPNA